MSLPALTRRTALVLGAVALPMAAQAQPSDDAALIAACHDWLSRRAHLDSLSLSDEEMGVLIDAEETRLDAISSMRPTTLRGFAAKVYLSATVRYPRISRDADPMAPDFSDLTTADERFDAAVARDARALLNL